MQDEYAGKAGNFISDGIFRIPAPGNTPATVPRDESAPADVETPHHVDASEPEDTAD